MDVKGPTVRRSNEIYESQLKLKCRGYPLWIPQPNLNLPIPYRIRGTSIGDVGVITSYGSFDFLFNIFLPHNDPSNPGELPDGFQPMRPPLNLMDVGRYREFSSGSFLASSSVSKMYTNLPASGLTFESSDVEGAILTMPDGAYHEEVGNQLIFRTYIAAHAENWYKFVNGPRGREAKNGDIHLVVGCDKTTAWGMAAFANDSKLKIQLKFRLPEQQGMGSCCTHFWERSTMAEVRAGPDSVESEDLGAASEQPPENQGGRTHAA